MIRTALAARRGARRAASLRGASLRAVKSLAANVLAASFLATTLLATLVTSLGCPLEDPAAPIAIVVGNVSIARDTRDEQRYSLTMEVLNETDHVLRSLTFYARVAAVVTTENALTTTMSTTVPTTVGSGVRIPVTAILQSPFPVVPPVPLTLTEIRIGEFSFSVTPHDDPTYTLSGWISYPWPVEEER
ncbi:MAG: hypothetical protein EA427_06925 [Spirochaetaceae bacterium]|nr:MAG: hypothetical protein EA427_06925 [Spirochaetaceae bacterium]